jgi:hypothetical protein
VASDLAANPPLKFDLSQKVRVFNTRFEFVELEIKGCFIARKSVRIPSDLLALGRDPRTRERLHTNYKLIDGENEGLSGEMVRKLRDFIARKFLIQLPGYGNVVLRANKERFERAIRILKGYVARFRRRVEKELQAAIDENRRALVESLIPAVVQNPPSRCTKYLGPNPDREAVEQWLDSAMQSVFGKAPEYIEEMEVKVIFKGVTYESLNDPDFINVAESALPMMKKLYEEFDTAKLAQENSKE